MRSSDRLSGRLGGRAANEQVYAPCAMGSILDHVATSGHPGDMVRADEAHSAQPGTSARGRFGQ